MVSGKVISKEKQEVVDFATVYLKGTTYGCTTNEEGIYHLHAHRQGNTRWLFRL